MAPGEYIASSCNTGYSNYSFAYWYNDAQALLAAARLARHREFVESLVKKPLVARPTHKSISLLTRAVNAPILRTHIRQPCWRAGRWKSLT